MSYSHIVVAFDGSDLSKKALEHAVNLAKAFGSKLTVVHAYATPIMNSGDMLITAPPEWAQQYYEMSSKAIDVAKLHVPPELAADYEMIEGYPAQAVLSSAKDRGADLIVLGSRGLGAIREFVLGSVSHNVAQHAEIPVLIVK